MAITVSTGTTHGRITQNAIIAGYICSHCHSPNIKIIKVRAVIAGSASGFGKVSEEELAKESAVYCQKGIERLTSFLQNPTRKTFPTDGELISYLGLNTPCPACGQVESWQSVQGLRTQGALSDIHTFPSMDRAYEWAQTVLKNRKTEADMILSSAEKRDALLRLQEETAFTKKALQTEMENGEAVQRVALLEKKHAELSAKLKGLSIFSKEKKQTQKELENCEKETQEAKDNLKNEQKRLTTEILKAEMKMDECQLLQIRYSDESNLFREEESIAVMLREKDKLYTAGYVVSHQPLPQIVSARVSPFEKNKNLLTNSLISLLLEKTSETKEGTQ